jgi:hypothetical protein
LFADEEDEPLTASRNIRPHHRRSIELLCQRFQDDPRFLALIAGGSVVKGIARDDSDVDIIFVAS